MPFIFYAVEKNNIEMVKYLVEKGADVNYLHYVNRNDVFSPLSMALRVAFLHQSSDVIDYLRSKGAKLPNELMK
jgi:ankyrin repeat protein